MKFFVKTTLALCLLASVAHAHVTANPDTGVAGKYFETKFRISHGCEGADTTSVSISLPKDIYVVKPQSKAGWNVDITKSKLDKPVSIGHGKTTDEKFETVTWSGSVLPDAQYDEFGLLFKLPEKSGTTLWFPVMQTCVKGEHKWREIPAEGQQWHELKSPAPFVKILAPAATEHHH